MKRYLFFNSFDFGPSSSSSISSSIRAFGAFPLTYAEGRDYAIVCITIY